MTVINRLKEAYVLKKKDEAEMLDAIYYYCTVGLLSLASKATNKHILIVDERREICAAIELLKINGFN